jgi:hypothetical protein
MQWVVQNPQKFSAKEKLLKYLDMQKKNKKIFFKI